MPEEALLRCCSPIVALKQGVAIHNNPLAEDYLMPNVMDFDFAFDLFDKDPFLWIISRPLIVYINNRYCILLNTRSSLYPFSSLSRSIWWEPVVVILIAFRCRPSITGTTSLSVPDSLRSGGTATWSTNGPLWVQKGTTYDQLIVSWGWLIVWPNSLSWGQFCQIGTVQVSIQVEWNDGTGSRVG